MSNIADQPGSCILDSLEPLQQVVRQAIQEPICTRKESLKEKTLKREQSRTTQAANFRQLANAASWETCCPTVCGLLDDSFQGAVVILSHWPFKMGTPCKREVWVWHHVVQVVPFEKCAAAPLKRTDPRSFCCSLSSWCQCRCAVVSWWRLILAPLLSREWSTRERAIRGLINCTA